MLRPRHTLALPLLAAMVCLAILLVRLPDMPLEHDEVEHVHAAWLVSIGDRPFLDFAEHHNPPLWYLLAPLMPDGDDLDATLFRCRLVTLLFSLLTAAAAWLFARLFVGPILALLAPAALLLSMYWDAYAFQVRPDALMTLLVVSGTGLLAAGLRSDRIRPLFAAGALLGAACAALLKAAIVAVAAGAFLLLLAAIQADRRALRLRQTAALAAGGIAAGSLFVAWLWAAGLLEGFWFWVVEFNRKFVLLNTTDPGFPAWDMLSVTLEWDPLLWLGLAAGTAAVAARHRRDPAALLLLVVTGTVLAGLFTTPYPHYQYLQPALPLFAVLGAIAAGTVAGLLRARLSPSHALALAGLVAVAAAGVGGRTALELTKVPDNADQLARLQRVLAVVPPGETVIASPPVHPILRRDAITLWFNNAGQHNVLDRMDPPAPWDRFRTDPERLANDPPAALVAGGRKFHSWYRIGDLAQRCYEPLPGDGMIWVRTPACTPTPNGESHAH